MANSVIVSVNFEDGSYYTRNYTIEMTQIASTTPGKVRMQMRLASFQSWFNDNPRPFIIATDMRRSNVVAQSNAVTKYDTAEVDLDSKYLSETLYVNWQYYSKEDGSGSVSLSSFTPSYALTITKNEGVKSVTVNRTASAIGATGVLSNGVAIYTGDVLEVSAEAESGWELNAYESTITVSGNVTVAPTAKQTGGTVHIYQNVKWQKHKLMVYRGGAWAQHKAVIYKDSAWSQYN